ncbi:hypothetical protein [Christiangramia flava]|uniref:Uncharacterized protein n=1 Tax=Christiangramia flava JLT2011 TaxID=1229726 RepID=A0A1L7I660_9FLAO|nr:hypothetical protein [Christiangramia flava]APU68592.1 hypothetical protein GRFL_1868 [Christiangramia flava JLT2011]OSS40621.1 hypothetical protein C723_0030 [Christiangramia flava JLT2011]
MKNLYILLLCFFVISCSENSNEITEVEVEEGQDFPVSEDNNENTEVEEGSEFSVEGDRIIFGNYSDGYCSLDCRELFLIKDGQLFRDMDIDGWIGSERQVLKHTSFDTVPMSQEQFEKVKGMADFPESIFVDENVSDDVIHQLTMDFDYYIYIEKDGKSQQIIFDHINNKAKPEIKKYFKTFIESQKALDVWVIDTTKWDLP